LAELIIVQVTGRVEDERYFFTLTFMKTKLQNWLTMQLELVIQMFNQKFFTLQNFLFEVIKNLKDNKIQFNAKSWGLSCYQLAS
jgi:hypothetical protein